MFQPFILVSFSVNRTQPCIHFEHKITALEDTLIHYFSVGSKIRIHWLLDVWLGKIRCWDDAILRLHHSQFPRAVVANESRLYSWAIRMKVVYNVVNVYEKCLQTPCRLVGACLSTRWSHLCNKDIIDSFQIGFLMNFIICNK